MLCEQNTYFWGDLLSTSAFSRKFSLTKPLFSNFSFLFALKKKKELKIIKHKVKQKCHVEIMTRAICIF
jgi:hypothetical protein